jgi:hypothetical protein
VSSSRDEIELIHLGFQRRGESVPQNFVYKGQEIKVDVPECKDAFMQDPDSWLKKVQEAAKKPQAPAKSQR